jgi:hypothetical protein
MIRHIGDCIHTFSLKPLRWLDDSSVVVGDERSAEISAHFDTLDSWSSVDDSSVVVGDERNTPLQDVDDELNLCHPQTGSFEAVLTDISTHDLDNRLGSKERDNNMFPLLPWRVTPVDGNDRLFDQPDNLHASISVEMDSLHPVTHPSGVETILVIDAHDFLGYPSFSRPVAPEQDPSLRLQLLQHVGAWLPADPMPRVLF